MESLFVGFLSIAMAFIGIVQLYKNSINDNKLESKTLNDKIYEQRKEILELRHRVIVLKKKINKIILAYKKLEAKNKKENSNG